MTSRAEEASVRHYASGAPPPARRSLDADRSMRGASLIAGIGILLIVPLAVFGNFVVLEGLVTQGDAERTARDITASEGVFRLGIVSLFVVIALDVVVACAMFRVFSPVSRGISMLAACFRIVFAGVFMVAAGELVGVLRLLGHDDHLGVFDADQLYAQALLRINTFTDIWDAGLVFFGLHLLIIGYLAYMSGFVPRILGVLLVIAGLGYLSDSLGGVLFQGYTTNVAVFTFLGELLLAVWLLLRARHIGVATSGTSAESAASNTPATASPTADTLVT